MRTSSGVGFSGSRTSSCRVCSISHAYSLGIAYTIDPAYESEVRDYLGKLHSLDRVKAATEIHPRLPRKGTALCTILQCLS